MGTAVHKFKNQQRFVGQSYLVQDQSGMEFDDVVEEFIKSRKLGTRALGARGPARPRTMDEYRYDLAQFVALQTKRGHTHWNDMHEKDVTAFFDLIQSKSIEQSSKDKVYRTVRALFTFVRKSSTCKQQGMKDWRELLPSIGKGKERVYVPKPEEMQRFLDAIDPQFIWGLRDKVTLTLMLDCGVRIGEVCLMTPEDINFEAMQIHIPKLGKTGERLVFMTETSAQLLKQWIRERQRVTKTGWLFVSKSGGKMTPGGYDQAFARHRKASKMDKNPDNLTPHTVRHYFCTYYLVNGGTLPGLKQMTGHKRLDTLMIYVHLADQIAFVQDEHSRVSPLKSLVEGEAGSTKPSKRRKMF